MGASGAGGASAGPGRRDCRRGGGGESRKTRDGVGGTRSGNGATQLRAPSDPGEADPCPAPRSPRSPSPRRPRGLGHPRVSDCPTGCADVADPLIHSSCLGHGRKAASSPGNDCISKSPLTIPLTTERERRRRGEALKCFS